jgi:3-isopropylmalate/(R)-2-methylmalate dehydratase small subunit
MKTRIQGKVYVVENNIDTDVIIPARYMNTMDPDVLKKHAMEDLDPKQYPVPFLNPDGSCNYTIIIAGKNFGCGSSREHAPIALRAAGVEAVVALSFARIFYRNCVNGGHLLPLEIGSDLTQIVATGEEVEINLSVPSIRVPSRRLESLLKPFGPVKDIIEAGGLTAYNKKRMGLLL